MASSSDPKPPAERASEIVNSLPSSPNLVTKTGSVLLGTGILAAAISQELYVFNEETVIAAGYLILFTYIARVRPVRHFPSCTLLTPGYVYPSCLHLWGNDYWMLLGPQWMVSA